jgi:molybdopterin-guanine dinucleotide biosynthesis protein A
MNRSNGIAGLVLCGGRATRMGGGDKCLLPLGASTVLSHVVDRAAPQLGQIAISANSDPDRFNRFALTVLPDAGHGHAGPLAGILAGMDWFCQSGKWRAIVSLAGDTPFLPDDLVARLAIAASGESNVIAVATSRGQTHPVTALWPLSLRDDLRRFLANGEDRSVRGFASRHTVVEVPFDDMDLPGGPCDPFFNINRPDDLEAANRFLKGPSA